MYHDSDDIHVPWGRIALAVVTLCVILPLGFFLLNSALDQHLVQPVRRQNLNHDADWLRAKTQEVVNLNHDFQVAQQAEAADVAQLHAYVAANGDPKTWGAYDPRGQVYQQMFNKYAGDYQAEVSDAQQFDADRDNPDYAPVWADPAVAQLPERLDAGPQPGL